MFVANPMNANWRTLLEKCLMFGSVTAPRGKKIKELIAQQSFIPVKDALLTDANRHLSYRFMFAEAFWILSGSNQVHWIARFNKRIAEFSDDGQTFFGAYGPKLYDQLNYVKQTLRDDLNSRQAVVNIWRDSPQKSKDIPCTLSVQFLSRHHDGMQQLHAVVTMRSSDLWLGYPYDVFNWACAVVYLCILMRPYVGNLLVPGNIYLTAGSQHLYETNFEQAELVLKQPSTQLRHGELIYNPHHILNPDLYADGPDFLHHLETYAETEQEIYEETRANKSAS